MKKILVLLLTLCLFAGCALAEEAVELNWSDAEAAIEEAGIEGSFYTFDDVAVQVWIPDIFENKDLTEDNVEDGAIGRFELADESAGVYVQYLEGYSGATMDEFEAGLAETEAIEVERVVLNGMEGITYTVEDTDAMYLVFITERGNYVQFIFYPMSDEGYSSTASLIAMSIQPE